MDTQRQDEGNCSLTVDGKPAPMTFSNRTGGATGSSGSKTFPGNMQPQKAHGGPQEIEDVTLEGEFVPVRDHEWMTWLKSRVGKGNAAVVENILDSDGNFWGKLDDWSGKLSKVDPGDYDASSSEPKKFTVEVETDGRR